ncbi:MAG: DNA (cytosine-5-)-methyltransferase [Candidatus Aenigmarchaeota archaeon]|nr:DNA (cytosine-5-)-methyltransferase [Candidatus Aenigmarchaeota archaeon]
MKPKSLTFGSLFSGIGGMDLGFERAGMKCLWQVEIDECANKILKKHWPNVKRYKDIRAIRKIGYVDVIGGGFPCQDISNAGNREGITGKRSGLWKEFLRIIRMVRPKYVVVENVAALLNRGIDTVLADLSACGYNSEWDCLPAQAVGAPHRRDRVFIIAYANDLRCVMRKSERQGVQREDETCNETYTGNKDMAHCKNERGTCSDTERNKCRKPEAQIGERSSDISNSDKVWVREHEFLQKGIISDSDSKRTQIPPERKLTAIEVTGRDGKKRTIISDTDYYYYWKQRQKSIQETNRRKYWATDAGILRVANGIPKRVERIKCLGNAIVPQVAEFIGEQVIYLDEEPNT